MLEGIANFSKRRTSQNNNFSKTTMNAYMGFSIVIFPAVNVSWQFNINSSNALVFGKNRIYFYTGRFLEDEVGVLDPLHEETWHIIAKQLLYTLVWRRHLTENCLLLCFLPCFLVYFSLLILNQIPAYLQNVSPQSW